MKHLYAPLAVVATVSVSARVQLPSDLFMHMHVIVLRLCYLPQPACPKIRHQPSHTPVIIGITNRSV